MKHTIETRQGVFTVQPMPEGAVSIKFKPLIWPEVGMILTQEQSADLADAVEICSGLMPAKK